MAVKDDRVFIGGNFAAVGGEPRQNLAAVDADRRSPLRSIPLSFAPQVSKTNPTPYVYALPAGDSKLYIGGLFSHVDGRGRANLAAFDLATNHTRSLVDAEDQCKPRQRSSEGERPEVRLGQGHYLRGGSVHQRNGLRRYAGTAGKRGTPRDRHGRPSPLEDSRRGDRRSAGRVGPGCHPYEAIWGLRGRTEFRGGVQPRHRRRRNAGLAVQDRRERADRGTLAGRHTAVLGGHFGTNRLEQRVCGDQNISGIASVDPATGAIYCDWIPQLEPSFENGNGARAFATTDTSLRVGGGFTHASGTEQRNLARFRYDNTSPRVVRAVPANGATGVRRGINVISAFSERAYKVRANFKLYRRGSSTPVPAVVSPVEGTSNRRWALPPKSSLRAGTTYIAKVLTGVEDGAGISLDQNQSNRATS